MTSDNTYLYIHGHDNSLQSIVKINNSELIQLIILITKLAILTFAWVFETYLNRFGSKLGHNKGNNSAIFKIPAGCNQFQNSI